jgi:beta-glucosidase/6-phospho-beta-glucosidase/beta-galactosidase
MKVLTLISFLSDGSGEINQAGVDHYNKLINALLAKGKHLHISKLG